MNPRTDEARAEAAIDRGSRGSGAVAITVVLVALAIAVTLFLAILGIGYEPTQREANIALALGGALIFALVLMVARQGVKLARARRAGLAGARLHARVVFLLSAIAVVPPILIAGAALVALERALDPWFTGDLRVLARNADVIARQFQQQLCQNIGREMKLMGADLERARQTGAYEQNRPLFREFMTTRAVALGFPQAVMVQRDRTILESAAVPGQSAELPPPNDEDFELAGSSEPPCLISRRAMGGVLRLPGFTDAYLVVARPVDPRAIDFPLVAQAGVQQYQALEARRGSIQLGFIIVFALMTLVVLLAAILAGLGFANRLVDPIRRLIQATDQVALGNLYVQVPIRRGEGDLAHLGQTFNNMTAVLRNQTSSLMAANELINQRRQFMEAVLSGVPAGVLGLDANGRINLVNSTAQTILGAGEAELIGTFLAERLPDLAPVLAEARAPGMRPAQMQVQSRTGGRERTLSVRVTRESGGGLVVTLDDITDFVAAQRTSAWADVARRIAHEIKNPLTPIQLSAERIRRKFGKVIVEDRAVFEQCTDTIVRQVDDIKRMVDEFSSFARMPKPRAEDADIGRTIQEIVFLMRVAHPDITIDETLPDRPVIARFDRRLMSQAIQNIIKNAAEALAATSSETLRRGRIEVRLDPADGPDVVIDIIDNGKGFPTENRARLLEPYMTTREGGTGLGLPIVAKILEDHGGRIELLDAPGHEGAMVRLSFPRTGNPAGEADDAQHAAGAERERPGRTMHG